MVEIAMAVMEIPLSRIQDTGSPVSWDTGLSNILGYRIQNYPVSKGTGYTIPLYPRIYNTEFPCITKYGYRISS